MEEPVFNVIFRHLNFAGVHPFHKTNVAFMMLNIASVIFLSVLLLLKLIFDTNLHETELTNIFVMISIKYLVVVFKKEAIRILLEDIKAFWTEECEDENLLRIINYLRKITSIWHILYYLGLITYLPKPILIRVEAYFILIMSKAYVGFVVLLMALINLTAAQFRRINIKLEQLNIEAIRDESGWNNCSDSLRACIKHHAFLIDVVRNVNEILYIPVGLLVGDVTLLMCLHMYLLTTDHLDWTELVRVLITSMGVLLEFVFSYGIPAQMLMNEAADMADALYSRCTWYMATPPIKKTLQIMLMRSQKVVCISIKNLIIINNQTFLMMLKTAYSFYAFLRTVTSGS